MKKILLLALLLMLTIISCGGSGQGKSGEKELRVGLETTFAPFEYKENGQLVGFDVDLINEIGKNLGYKITFVEQSFDGLIPALKSGKIDMVISGMSATAERKQSVDFSDEYFIPTQAYLRKKGNQALNSKESLKGKKIGVQLGTVQETTAKQVEGANVIPNESTVTVIMDLKAGKIDAMILENVVAGAYIKKNPELEIFFEEKIDAGMAMAFDKGKNNELISQVNAELKKLKENGKYDELLKKYELDAKKAN